jgi:hypothetical protein
VTHAFDALPPAPATPLTFSSLRSRRYEGFYEGFEETTWKAFGKKSSLSGTAYSGEHVVGDIELRYWSFDIQQLEFKRTVETDMLFSMGSIIFVFTWIYIHVGSYFLAAIAMTQIVSSLPIGNFFYKVIGGIPVSRAGGRAGGRASEAST